MGKAIAVAAVVSALVLAAGAGARPDAFKPRACGQVTVRKGNVDQTYAVKVFQAPLACSTAQTTMSRFLLSGVVPRRWFCRYGHSSDKWAAACARTSRTGPIVRAYTIVR